MKSMVGSTISKSLIIAQFVWGIGGEIALLSLLAACSAHRGDLGQIGRAHV